MKNKINITESEWKIMQIIWNEPYLTLGEIKKRLDKDVVWDKTTINTLIRRLRKKGVVGIKEARYYKYYALVPEEECLQGEIDSILKRFFYSSPNKLIATLIKHQDFDNESLDELEKLIDEIREKNSGL
jgi:BlaI family penicillinase repressor